MPRIELILDEPSTERLREGYSNTFPAGTLRGSRWVEGYDEDGGRYIRGELCYERDGEGNVVEAEGLWRVPEEGIILSMPNALRRDLVTNPAYAGDWLGLGDFDKAPDDFEEVVLTGEGYEGQPKILLTKRANEGSDLTGIAAPPRVGALDIASRGLVWAAKSTAILKPNEGVSILSTPFGAGAERAPALFGLMFGARFYIEVGADGWADLYQDVSRPAQGASWVRRRRFQPAQGGFSDAASVQVTVIPWGIDAITVVWSIAPGAGQESAGSSKDGSLTFHGRRYDWDFTYSAPLKHYVKTEAGPIHLALPKRAQSQIGVLPVRYATALFCVGEVPLGEPKPDQNVQALAIGYYPGGSSIPVDFEGPRGPYAGATDDRIVPFGSLAVSDPVYSPELWALEVSADPVTYTANTTPLDFSALWRRIEGRSTIAMETTRLEALVNRSGDVSRLLRCYGTVRLAIDGETVFKGRVEASRFVMEGGLGEEYEDGELAGYRRSYGVVTDDLCAVDLWQDLEDTPASFTASFAKKTLGEILEKAFARSGIPPAGYSIASELYEIEVDGWDRADDFKVPSEDTRQGDLVRSLSYRYGVQGHAESRRLRIYPIGGVHTCVLSPDWQTGDDPFAYLWLHPDALPDEVNDLTEEERWQLPVPWIKALSEPNWDVVPPEFDAMRAWAVSGTGDGSDTMAAYIAADPRRTGPTADVDSPDFVRRPRYAEYGPPETSLATTPNELERLARREFDRGSRFSRLTVVDAEWRPSLRADRILYAVGLRPDTGEPCCFGAFRVLESAWCLLGDEEVASEEEGAMNLGRALWWTTRLTLDYLGDPELDGYPLFTQEP